MTYEQAASFIGFAVSLVSILAVAVGIAHYFWRVKTDDANVKSVKNYRELWESTEAKLTKSNAVVLEQKSEIDDLTEKNEELTKLYLRSQAKIDNYERQNERENFNR